MKNRWKRIYPETCNGMGYVRSCNYQRKVHKIIMEVERNKFHDPDAPNDNWFPMLICNDTIIDEMPPVRTLREGKEACEIMMNIFIRKLRLAWGYIC